MSSPFKIQSALAGATVSAWSSVCHRLTMFVTAVVVTYSSALAADDTEIFFSREPYIPNVLFVLDTSGSMDELLPNGQSRIEGMKSALEDLICSAPDNSPDGCADGANLQGVNIGLMNFANTVLATRVITEIGSVEDTDHQAEFLTGLNALQAGGGTPTVRALWYAKDYFKGDLHENPTDSLSSILPSPIENECQQNHVVLLTDGRPSGESDAFNTELNALVGGEGGCASNPLDQGTDGDTSILTNGFCGAELTKYMYDVEKIKTHTIGLSYEQDWLQSLSQSGGEGVHATVNNTEDLSAAFREIFEGFASTFAAPTVSVNSYAESRHRDELFYSLFQTRGSVRWEGNVKKYRISDEGIIVDKNDISVIDDQDLIDPASRSFWSDASDGEAVSAGGFAAKLRVNTDRNWYTDYNVAPVNGEITPVEITVDNQADFPLTNEESDFVRSGFVADTLHNSPVLLSYWATKSTAVTPARSEVLFTANNMGMLHALDAETGDELWAYTPSEHMPTIQSYFADATSVDHVYGLDGNFTLHTERDPQPNAANSYEVDTAWLFMTERRGGNRVYALDVSNGDQETNPFKVMWKITGGELAGEPFDIDTDNDGVNDRHYFADLAQTWSKPQMITVRSGCPDACASRELLMFSGGYNADVYDNKDLEYDQLTTPNTGHGNAVYLVNPETGALVWSVGNGAHHSLNLPIEHSVPTTPVVIDSDADGNVNILYFSDIAGNVWRIDLDQRAGSNDELHLSGGQIAALSPPDQNLRFFNQIDVVRNGTSVSTAFYNLMMGSGMRSSPLYQEPHLNKLFVLRDRWVFNTPQSENPSEAYQYVKHTDGSSDIIRATSDIMRDVSDSNTSTSVEYGFYRPFEQGEKVLEPTFITRNSVFTVTYMPPASDVPDEGCVSPLGSSRLYINDLPSGEIRLRENGAEYEEIGSGLKSGPQLIDTGSTSAPFIITGNTANSLESLLGGSAADVTFRKFQRTGWIEKDGFTAPPTQNGAAASGYGE